MMQRRNFLWGSAVLLTACGGPATARPLEFWTMQLQPDHTALIQSMLTAFSQANPTLGTIKWVDVPWADMEKKILSAVAAGTAPDVVNLNPQFAVKLAQRDALLSLDDKVPQVDQERYFPSLWQANRLKGSTFGLPWYVSTQVTIFNRTLLAQAGVQAPRSYGELQKVAQAVKSKTGKYAFLPTFDTSQILESWVKMGVPLITAQGQANFNQPDGIKMAQFWVDLYQNQLLPRETLTEGHRKAIELYQAQQTALLLSGPQFLQGVEKNAPDLAQITGVAPQIVGSAQKTNASAMNLVIPKATTQPEQALKLALFITNSDNQLALAKAANLLPSVKAATQDTFFTLNGSDPATQGRVVSAQQLKNAEVLIPPFDNLDQLQKLLYEEIQQAMLGKKTADQAIQAAALGWNKLV